MRGWSAKVHCGEFWGSNVVSCGAPNPTAGILRLSQSRTTPVVRPTDRSSALPTLSSSGDPAMGKFSAWLAVLMVIAVEASKSKHKACDKGWECSGSIYCCNETISEYFVVYQFENLFSKRNAPVAHAVGFWDYQSFIIAASVYEPLGFGTAGDKQTKMKEVAAFLGHVGSKTSC
ncbi:unnamed protein product, partial [Musa banksii]